MVVRMGQPVTVSHSGAALWPIVNGMKLPVQHTYKHAVCSVLWPAEMPAGSCLFYSIGAGKGMTSCWPSKRKSGEEEIT